MTARPPLQNRVDPFGALAATAARGALMGNRGGRIHDAEQRLTGRRWASRRWICCVCAFNGRHRQVWGKGYTELFFLDEVTALAAGHRPCFECRRADALRFQACFARGQAGALPGADTMDAALHRERLASGGRAPSAARADDLPDGAMIVIDARPMAVSGGWLLPWSFDGYGAPLPRFGLSAATALTPACVIAVLRNGYRPQWHASAGRRPLTTP